MLYHYNSYVYIFDVYVTQQELENILHFFKFVNLTCVFKILLIFIGGYKYSLHKVFFFILNFHFIIPKTYSILNFIDAQNSKIIVIFCIFGIRFKCILRVNIKIRNNVFILFIRPMNHMWSHLVKCHSLIE